MNAEMADAATAHEPKATDEVNDGEEGRGPGQFEVGSGDCHFF